METTNRTRILVKSSVGEFASDWEDRTDLELQEVHAAVQMLLQGEMAYMSLISKKSVFYISEEMCKTAVILIQTL